VGQFRLDLILSDLFVVLGPLWAIGAVALLVALVLLPLQRSFGVGLAFLMLLQIWVKPLYFTCSRLRWWVIGILVVRGLALLLTSKPRVGETRVPHVVLGLLAGWALVSSVWSDVPEFSFLVAATFVAGVVVSFVLVWRLSDSVDVVAFICRWSVVVSLCLFGASFVVGAWAMLWEDALLLHRTGIATGRYAGIFGNPNGSGVLAAMLLPFVFAAPRDALGGVARLRPLALVLLVAAVPLSGSRSAVLGSIVAVGVVALYRFRAGAAVFGGLILATTATLMLATPVETIELIELGPADRIVRASTLSNLSDRVGLWETGWDAAMESPWIGSGWSISRVLDGRDVSRALEIGRVRAGTNLHNAHLQILVDLGVVGLALFWFFGFLVASASLRVIAGGADRGNAINVVIVASLAVMWGDSFVHGWIFSFGNPSALVFWACCALVLKAADRQRLEAAAAEAQRPARVRQPVRVRPPNVWPQPVRPSS